MASNRGEWAELYAALKLLSEGKLYLADREGKRNLQEYMKIIELIRHEAENRIVKYNYAPEETDCKAGARWYREHRKEIFDAVVAEAKKRAEAHKE